MVGDDMKSMLLAHKAVQVALGVWELDGEVVTMLHDM